MNFGTMDNQPGIFNSNTNSSHNMFSSSNTTTTEYTGNLMRYHSAPHSVLAGLLDDDFGKEDAEFEKMLNDGIGSFSSLLDMKPINKSVSVSDSIMIERKEEEAYLTQNPQNSQYVPPIRNNFQEQLSPTPLSVIRENMVEEPLDQFLNPRPLVSSNTQPNLMNQISPAVSSTNSTLLYNPQVNSLSRTNSGLRRQSSSPAAILSRVVSEETAAMAAGASDKSPKPPKAGGVLLGQQNVSLHSPRGVQNIGSSQGFQSSVQQQLIGSSSSGMSSGLPLPSRPNLLLRQSSSPAGLLSDLAYEEMGLTSPGSPGYLQRGGWGNSAQDLGDQTFGLGKRGRGLDERSLMNSMASPQKNFSMAAASNFDLDGSSMDPLLIKARAKRGCATHPRSIAERVRRTKISERIKKLQDLVPNLDKQSSTAEMLDEVVEYVKQLQWQVKELSMKPPHCTGKCQQTGNEH